MSGIEVDVGVLKERVDNMEKQQDTYCKKVDNMNGILFTTMGGVLVTCIGVIANLMILLGKK